MSFIDLETAAARSGWSVGHLRRLCGSKWMAGGLARLEPPAGGGKPAWMVSEDADPALARVKFAEQLSEQFDLRTISAKARAKAQDRKRIVEAWQANVAAGRQLQIAETKVTQDFVNKMIIEENRTLSRATLFNWARAARDGIQGLVKVYGEGSPAAPVLENDPFVEAVKSLWLRKSRPPLKTCYDYARLQAEQDGWAVCSFKTIQRRMEQIPQQVVIKKRLGATAFANQVLPPSRRDYTGIDANSWWCSDHHQFDCWVHAGTGPDGKPKYARPWITGWEDLRSRKITGWHIFIHDPNQTTILLSLRAGCLADGIPRHVYVDNGKDYDCYSLQGMTKSVRVARRKFKVPLDSAEVGGVLGALDIKLTHAIPFNAKAKPIERFFNTVCSRFTKFIDTYCGRNPQERPENLPELMKYAMPVEEFARQFETWLEGDYHQRPHSGHGMQGPDGEPICPAAAFEQFMVSRRVAREQDLQLLIARTSKPLTCDREGVVWRNIRYGKGDPALFQYFKKKIYLRIDPADVSRATAWSEDDRFIAELDANWDMPFGATDEDHRRAEREKKNIRELTNRYHALGAKRTASVGELLAIGMAERRALPAPPAGGPSIMPVRTPLEGQSIPLRKAAGAEGMSPRPAGHRPKVIDLLAEADDLLDAPAAALPRLSMANFFEGD